MNFVPHTILAGMQPTCNMNGQKGTLPLLENISDTISEIFLWAYALCIRKPNKLSKSCGFEDVMSGDRTLGA